MVLNSILKNAPNIKKTNNSGVWVKGGDGNQDGVD